MAVPIAKRTGTTHGLDIPGKGCEKHCESDHGGLEMDIEKAALKTLEVARAAAAEGSRKIAP